MAGLGYVKLYREAREHAVFQDDWHWRLFCWCLLKANFRPSQFRGIEVSRGSFVTGRIAAAEELKTTQSRIYRGFEALKRLGCITLKPNNKWTLITVCNFESYQNGTDDDRTTDEQQTDSSRTTNEQQTDTSKEEQEGKKGRSNTTSPSPEVGQLVSSWNATPGVVRVAKLTAKRAVAAKARLGDSDWDWKSALGKFPLRCFAGGGWTPTFDWFVRPDTVMSILEGKYDWSKGDEGNHCPRLPTPEEDLTWNPLTGIGGGS